MCIKKQEPSHVTPTIQGSIGTVTSLWVLAYRALQKAYNSSQTQRMVVVERTVQRFECFFKVLSFVCRGIRYKVR